MKTPADVRIEEVIRSVLPWIEALDERGNDSMDFHDVAVWSLRTLAERAFAAGRDFEAKRRSKKGKV